MKEFLNNLESISELLKNREDLAQKVYRALCNMRWKKGEEVVVFSWRASATLIADITNADSYLEYYCSGKESEVDPEVEELFKSWGYELLPY